jgi:glycosyltransferase involved in cell wall biosynthesis
MQNKSESKEHIAIIVSTCDDLGGAIRVGINLANRFCEDYEVHFLYVYGTLYKHQSMLDDRVVTKAFLPRELRQRKSAFALYHPLKKYLKQQDIKVAFTNGIFTGASVLPVAATTWHTSFVYCDHSAIAKREGQKDRVDSASRFLCSRFYDAVVTLTDQNKDDYIALFHANPKKLYRMYNWISPELLDRPVTYDQTARQLIWAGRFVEAKGIDLLVEIARQVLPGRPNWQWHVFGEGELEQDLTRKIAEHGLSEQLIIKPFCSDIYSLYPSYAAVTMTSYREGLPMVLLEGKASGLPLIAFDVITGPREIIRDGVDGFIISPYDVDEYALKLGQLMDEPQLRQTMSDNTRLDVERFSSEPIYQQWRALIEKLTK